MAARKRGSGEKDVPDLIPEEMSYEQAIEELEAIITRIEEGTVALEDSVRQYQRGTALIRRCREILDKAEQVVQVIDAAREHDAKK
jgi:exodeoxyribonuclease VII small subunit